MSDMSALQQDFATRLLSWWQQNGRKDLPWQKNPTAYRVWVSEIMLQQTQVKAVIPYYERFMQRFPEVNELADADIDEVLTYWSGLGYYQRCRNLHRAAKLVISEHDGVVPINPDELISLPGIGRSTAAAVASLATDKPFAILDGNVKRLFARLFALQNWPGEKKTENQLWEIADKLLPENNGRRYTQALMDFGATVCTRRQPQCGKCFIQSHCHAFKLDKVAELPVAKPKSVRPKRHKVFLIFQDIDNRIMLLKREAYGIWGGLYGFPECDSVEQVEQLAQQYISKGLEIGDHEKEYLSPLKHGFTHFELSITPILIKNCSFAEVSNLGKNKVQALDKTRWYKPDDGRSPALPVPVKRIMDNLYC